MRVAPKLRSLHLPPLRLCRLAVFSFVAYRAQIGRVGGSRWYLAVQRRDHGHVSIFNWEIEANLMMVSIGSVSIPRSRTVCIYISYASLLSVYSPIHHTDNRRQTFLTIGRAKP